MCVCTPHIYMNTHVHEYIHQKIVTRGPRTQISAEHFLKHAQSPGFDLQHCQSKCIPVTWKLSTLLFHCAFSTACYGQTTAISESEWGSAQPLFPSTIFNHTRIYTETRAENRRVILSLSVILWDTEATLRKVWSQPQHSKCCGKHSL